MELNCDGCGRNIGRRTKDVEKWRAEGTPIYCVGCKDIDYDLSKMTVQDQINAVRQYAHLADVACDECGKSMHKQPWHLKALKENNHPVTCFGCKLDSVEKDLKEQNLLSEHSKPGELRFKNPKRYIVYPVDSSMVTNHKDRIEVLKWTQGGKEYVLPMSYAYEFFKEVSDAPATQGGCEESKWYGLTKYTTAKEYYNSLPEAEE